MNRTREINLIFFMGAVGQLLYLLAHIALLIHGAAHLPFSSMVPTLLSVGVLSVLAYGTYQTFLGALDVVGLVDRGPGPKKKFIREVLGLPVDRL